eukprot:CAMPEP_0174261018 /NCGR_PEP_ID=MMETSP0439-20130205/11184_1 /TAXON_ID=0 /ORGANISM="Stereomyxa ramosa, Strain Chinc5" /LENGTH=412 /DNA_ID=CAMNT_0015345427 /DNA_START=97 /DNA_END=1335 /DNA_ORIENTATION=+
MMEEMMESLELEGSVEFEKRKMTEDEVDIDQKYNLDFYDQEGGGVNGVNKITCFDDNADDPYLTIKEDDDDELETITVRPTDQLLCYCSLEEEYMSHLYVTVWEEEVKNDYIHHDIMLSAPPLCIAWFNFAPGQPDGTGSFAAVGTFEPVIEIWNLDIIDALEPCSILGADKTQEFRRDMPTQPKLSDDAHDGAVMSLNWNKNHRSLLASSSADKTVKIWDLATENCLQTYTHHSDQVQVVRWHPLESNVLISASGSTGAVFDARQPKAVATFKTPVDIECIEWNQHSPKHFLMGTEDGTFTSFTIDNLKEPVFAVKAHEKELTAIAINPVIPGFVVTASEDKKLRMWDINVEPPKGLGFRSSAVAEAFAVSFCEDSPFTVAVGGRHGMKILNIGTTDTITEYYPQYFPADQ